MSHYIDMVLHVEAKMCFFLDISLFITSAHNFNSFTVMLHCKLILNAYINMSTHIEFVPLMILVAALMCVFSTLSFRPTPAPSSISSFQLSCDCFCFDKICTREYILFKRYAKRKAKRSKAAQRTTCVESWVNFVLSEYAYWFSKFL